MLFAALWLLFAPANVLPPGKAQAIVANQCGVCHSLAVVTAAAASRARWKAVVDEMVTDGAQLSPAEVPIVVDYLAKNFPERPAAAIPADAKPAAKRAPVNPPGPAPK